MSTNDAVALQAGTNVTWLRTGPHEDFAFCCEFETDLPDEWDAKTAKTVCDFVKGSLIGDSAEQRVNAAKTVLEQTDGKCGVAWLVLGREAAQSLEEAEDFLQKAF